MKMGVGVELEEVVDEGFLLKMAKAILWAWLLLF